jgi:UPF0716 family protein affecting phage T7 exclusion
MIDTVIALISWVGWALGLILFAAMTVLAFMTLRHRRVVMMQRDADERIKAFNERQ